MLNMNFLKEIDQFIMEWFYAPLYFYFCLP